ncbi:LysM peptidoglycan-binding domain-containing protein [Archangium violaceum]|uniref:LysM peptidoglycan-binding domain-containing protein n=1 Tax=Archangium violaceum TaxID=83451 RepID=UPI00195169E0|nr:LysM peptidoglycan-binding domain-containing protein [Archangium violaceum]QRN97205.1 LysM peptidoglycan-binding domain-containing protein [Archangium violaceum]
MSSIEYRVQSGDTLSAIARRYSVTMDALAQLNHISDINHIRAGQVLRIPKASSSPKPPPQPRSHRVLATDTLSGIAQRHKVSEEELAEANGLTRPYRLVIGQVLTLPITNPSPAPTSHKPASTAQLANTTPGNTPVSKKVRQKSPFERSKAIGSLGRVSNADGVNLREHPDSKAPIKKRLAFNTRVFAGNEFPGDWYFVTLEDGSFGYVYTKYVMLHPPEPGAILHKIEPGESALQIVKQYYKGSAISWGQDERYYVNVLVEANKTKALTGIYKPSAGADWSQTRTREGYFIWIPSLTFAKSLRDKVGSGSISYNLWKDVRRAAIAIGEYHLGAAAFYAGIIHGALESLWDLVAGVIDLVEMVWKFLVSLLTGELFSDAKGLWEALKALKLDELVKSGLEKFLARWNDPDLLRRWLFRGWLVGYAVLELLMEIFTGGAALVKWVGKAGKLSKLLTKFPKVQGVLEKAKGIAKSLPADLKKKLTKTVTESAEQSADLRKADGPVGPARKVDDVDDAPKVDPKKQEPESTLAQLRARFTELARDPAHNGKISSKTINEAKVGLKLEKSGKLKGPITRDPNPAGAEFIDADGIKWDVKSFRSDFPPKKGGFKLERDLEKIKSELAEGENVIIDTQKMSPQHVADLKKALSEASLLDRILWYP